MRWWTFNEQQLGDAMAEFTDRIKSEPFVDPERIAAAIIAFLTSPEVQAHKMRGDD